MPGYPLRSAPEVFWGRGWALWPHPGSGCCSQRERAQIPAVDACGGGQRGRRSEQAEGRRAHAPTRAPHPGLLPMSPRALEPRALRLESSPRAEPAHFSHHRIYRTACERVSPSPSPPPKMWADCKSCCSVIVCQTGPFSWERGEGHVAVPGPGLH